MTPAASQPMRRGLPPRISDQQILSALRSGRLSPRPATPAYDLDLLQRVRRLRQQQTKAKMNDSIRRQALIMSPSFGM